MNKKNRLAYFASQASIQFNTYLFFKNRDDIAEASVMKISKAGIYVSVRTYGIEGLLIADNIEVNSDNETAVINGHHVQAFTPLKVKVVAKQVELRRSIELQFINSGVEKQLEEDLSMAIKNKKRRK